MRRRILVAGVGACLVAMTGLLGACDTILGEESVDCSVHYQVRFRYDYNMKYADAFANEVHTVTVYAFDDEGRMVYQKTEEGDVLAEEGYAMDIDVEPGRYHLVTWAGLRDDASFAVPLVTAGVSTLDDLQCRMHRAYLRDSDGQAVVTSRLSSLWHGEVKACAFTRAATTQTVTVPLVKNTNTVRVILQQMEGAALDVDDFTFTITDDNGLMRYDNQLLNDETLTYYPYYRASGTTSTGRAEGSMGTAVAQLTVGRLVVDNHPVLTVTNRSTGEEVLSIPLVDYLLLAEAEGHDMTSQEYLDRQDEYNMTFFLDANHRWITSSILINDWKVELSEVDLSFTLSVGNAVTETRAGDLTWGQHEASGDGWIGDSYDNRIQPRTLQVYLYDENNRYKGEVTNLVYARRSTAQTCLYDFTGEVERSTLRPGTYKLMVMANADRLSGADSGWTDLTFGHQSAAIPMWGVATLYFTLEAGRRQVIDTPISLLRSMAKIGVSVSEEVASTLTLDAVTLTGHNTRGYVMPADPATITVLDDEGVEDRFRPLSSTAEESVAFVTGDDGEYVAYMTEKSNTDGDAAEIRVRFAERPDREYTLNFLDKATRAPFDIHRNHYYRFVITRVAAETVECDLFAYAADWTDEPDVKLTFQ